MPVYLKRFYFQLTAEQKEKENQKMKAQQAKMKAASKGGQP